MSVKTIKAERDALKREVEEMRSIRDRLLEEGKLLRQQSADKDRQVLRLATRLDAVLYALVLMQVQVQAAVLRAQDGPTEKREFKHSMVSGWEEVKPAGPSRQG